MLRFHTFSVEFPGGGEPFSLPIIASSQPTDRYSVLAGISPSVLIQIPGPQQISLPQAYEGFIVERSDDFGGSWADVSGVIRDSFFYVDTPPMEGEYYYRARMRTCDGQESEAGDSVFVTVGEWSNADDLGITELQTGDGAVVTRIGQSIAYPAGMSNDPHMGMSVAEGSLAGGHGSGAWYMGSKEFDPPTISGNAPACGAVDVPFPLNVFTFSIQDQPYPVGGSGIDDSSIIIKLSVTSQYGGSYLTIRSGAAQPFSPTITCVITPGLDPLLDRDVTITVPVDYLSSEDVVLIETYVEDLDGNSLLHECTFTMEHRDEEGPVITNQNPACGLGITDEGRASRDTSFSFSVNDEDSGIDLTSLQVFYGSSPLGPWTQILQNGTTWMLNFSGTITANIYSGYDVVVNRPTTDPLWPADSLVCFRIDVADVDANAITESCCFRTADEVSISRVVPIAEDVLFVEFSGFMKDGDKLRNAENFVIEPIGSENPVSVQSVLTQQFTPPQDPTQPNYRLGVGNPQFVFLDTTNHDFWGRYKLTVSNLEDQYGLPMKSGGEEASYRARRTKVDEGRETFEGYETREDGLMRKIMVAITHSDESIGGVFFSDDWES